MKPRRKNPGAETGDKAMPEIPIEDAPFEYSKAKLLSHKLRSQVVLCDYTSPERRHSTACILKFFAPRDIHSFQREVAVYSAVGEGDHGLQLTPEMLWSGSWSNETYSHVMGSLPSVLRGSETEVHVLMLSYVEGSEHMSRIGSARSKKYASRSALENLRGLHTLQIAHHDISESNVLLNRTKEGYNALWIDFSAAIVSASSRVIATEWQKALEYFSGQVYKQQQVFANERQIFQLRIYGQTTSKIPQVMCLLASNQWRR